MNDFDPDHLTKDEAYTIVARERRRTIIAVLLSTDEVRTVDDLSKEIARRETGNVSETIDEGQRQKIATALIHHHLPHLRDIGVIEFDRDAEVVDTNAHLEELDPLV